DGAVPWGHDAGPATKRLGSLGPSALSSREERAGTVVDPIQLTSDIVNDTVSLALPGLLWATLFLVAWERAPFAESIGFGRRSFWLLLPGALFASFALFPIAPVSTDWVAVSFTGAVLPLLAIEGGVLFLLVLPATAGFSHAFAQTFATTNYIGNELAVAVLATAFCAVVGGLALASGDLLVRRVAFLVVLTSGVLVSTFVASSTIPGVGIAESFPFSLVPPVIAGWLAVLLAGRVLPNEEGYAIPTAFLASTFGVLLGADLLRQPPL